MKRGFKMKILGPNMWVFTVLIGRHGIGRSTAALQFGQVCFNDFYFHTFPGRNFSLL